jgi:membrane protein YqaA with SNARE-associated domain
VSGPGPGAGDAPGGGSEPAPAGQAGEQSGEHPGAEHARERRLGLLRRLYDWVLGWAETRYGMPALFLLAFAESSVFPIPPDPLLMALCLGAPRRALRFAAVATVASVLGGMTGYALGFGAWSLVGPWFFAHVPGVTPDAFTSVQALYDRYDFWAVFLAGLTPIPYKVFTLSAGVFAISFPVFVVASAASRGLRFFLVAGLIYRFGKPIAAFIDRWFNWLAWAFGILIVLGFLVVERVL